MAKKAPKTGKLRGLPDKQLLTILMNHEQKLNQVIHVINQIGPKVERITDLFAKIAPNELAEVDAERTVADHVAEPRGSVVWQSYDLTPERIAELQAEFTAAGGDITNYATSYDFLEAKTATPA